MKQSDLQIEFLILDKTTNLPHLVRRAEHSLSWCAELGTRVDASVLSCSLC